MDGAVARMARVLRVHADSSIEIKLVTKTPRTYDKKFLDKKSWVKNHPFWGPKSGPYVRNPYVSLKKFLTQGPIRGFLIIRLGCTPPSLKVVSLTSRLLRSRLLFGRSKPFFNKEFHLRETTSKGRFLKLDSGIRKGGPSVGGA